MARIQRKVPAARTVRSKAQSETQTSAGTSVRRTVPLKHLVRFTRLLSTLTEAGLPIMRNLNILSDQWPEGKFRDTILDTAELVEEGQPLSEALAQHPEAFDDLFVNMARAGEAGGVLDKVLLRLAEFMEGAQDIRDRTRGAITYPLTILIVALCVITGLMVFVIPKFAGLFQEMDLELPAPTRILIATSDFLVVNWWVLILPPLFFLGYRMFYYRSFGFRRWNHSFWLRLPLVGKLMSIGQISRFANTFGTLVSSGVPHLRAFEIVRGALTNEIYREAVDDIQDEVREGEPIAGAMEATECFDDVVVSMVAVGEETGELDHMCLRVGASYEDHYKRTLDIVLKLLEPILLIMMAGVVGLIAVSLFLPMFKLLSQFGEAA
ncbi:MAG: type II secretion system F family protein [Planctomycetota bacterium]|nr:type II secretion system F family protein [Planctomycetota bacterium]